MLRTSHRNRLSTSTTIVTALLCSSVTVKLPSAVAGDSSTLRPLATYKEGRVRTALEVTLKPPGTTLLTPAQQDAINTALRVGHAQGKIIEQPISTTILSLIRQQTGLVLRQPVSLQIAELGDVLGIPREVGKIAANDLIYAYRQWDAATNVLKVYVTKAFYEQYLLHNDHLFAEVIDHEYAEEFFKLSHADSAARAWRFSNNLAGLSEFHKFFLDRLAAEHKWDILRAFTRDHPYDREQKFFHYVQRLVHVGEADASERRGLILYAPAAQRSFNTVKALIDALQTRPEAAPEESTDFVGDLRDYPTRYGKHALYYLLRDLDQGGYRMVRGQLVLPRLRQHLNAMLADAGVTYELAQLKPVLFWEAITRLTAPAPNGKALESYVGVVGMLRLEGELVGLVRKGQKAPHLSVLFDTFGSKKGQQALAVAFRSHGIEPVDLKWEKITLPYRRLVDAAREIAQAPEQYDGVVGMLRLAKWLDDKGDTSHLGTLYTAFGEKRAAVVVQALTQKALVDARGQPVKSLNWFHYLLPYEVVKPVADSLDRSLPRMMLT